MTLQAPKYPDVTVQLTGGNGNAYAIIGAVQRGLRAADVPPDEVEAFCREAMSGDYNNVLQTAMRWVDVE